MREKCLKLELFLVCIFPYSEYETLLCKSRLQTKCGKIQTKRNFECVHFSHRRNRKFCSIVPTSSKSILKVSKVRYFHLSKNEIFSWGLLHTAYKMKFSINNFFSKCDRIRSFLKKSLMENFIFCAVSVKVGTHWRFSNR